MASWKKTRRALRRPFETGGYLLLNAVIPCLPRGSVVGLSKLAGQLAMLLPLREKKIGLKNINAVFGTTKTPREKRKIMATSFSTFVLTMLDVFWFSRNPEKRIPKYSTLETNPETVSFFDDKPIILITAHMGSWEIIGQAIALMGVDVAGIAATVKNHAVNRVLIEQRQRTGQTIIPQKGALRTLIARLRNKGTVGFVLDQHTSKNEGGIVADFLGLPMIVSPAPAALAYRTGTEIMLVFCLPERGGRYRIQLTQTIVPPAYDKNLDADDIAQKLTQKIQDGISSEIRKYPEFWLWSYKHWRRTPGQTYPNHYPDY